MSAYLLRCTSLSLAQSRHSSCARQCPLSGVKRTSQFKSVTSAFDPKLTLRVLRNRLSVVRHFSLTTWSQSARL